MDILDFILRKIYFFLDQENKTYQYFENIDEGYGMLWGFVLLGAISLLIAFGFYYVWVGKDSKNATFKKWVISGLIGEIILIISLYGFIGGRIAEMSIDEVFFQNMNLFVLFNVLYFCITYYICSLIRYWSKAKYIPTRWPFKKNK